uniref:Predicted protein n=1 Tax=Hordeum vulgare subsp. vulgare TaxID=112509 RepID=F2DRZ7_HORVV|nr:predicted protein [Hordeum vulgare subsp. vulgare]
MQQSLKGKKIKDYELGETLATHNDMHLLAAHMNNNKEVTVLMVERKSLQQDTFVAYNNIIMENQNQVHPAYIDAVQSANNIYIVVEKIERLPAGRTYQQLLPSIVDLYRRMGDYKI